MQIDSEALTVIVTENGEIYADTDRDEALQRMRDFDGDSVVAREFELVVHVPPRVPAQAHVTLLAEEAEAPKVTIS
jgi:hypothetical protein